MPETATDLYEQTLVVRTQLGDEAAFEELLRLYGPRLLLFTRRMMQAMPQLVDDVTQETWLSIYRGLPRLLEINRFRSWAFRIARDRVYQEFRRRKLPTQSIDEMAFEELPATGDPATSESVEELQRGLDDISPEHREVLVLCFFEEMSYEEIAQVTACTLGTVRSRIFYAKRALKLALERKIV